MTQIPAILIRDHHEGRVTEPGFYRMSAALYHADPCPEPSLSSSVAKLLVNASPAHAHAAHPRLGKTDNDDEAPTGPKEIGTVAHKLILGHGAEVVVIDADAYRSSAAKAQRAEAYAAGHAPILKHNMAKAERVADAITQRLAQIPECGGFDGAPAEVVAIARDRSGAWFRIMMDRIEDHGTHATIWDVKTGETSAAPHGLGRRIEAMGMEVQAAFYVRVLETLLPHLSGRITFRWVFGENEPPHGVTVAQADDVALGIGGRKVALALDRWNKAMRTDRWPAYPAQIITPEYPGWAESRWIEREERDPSLVDVNWDITASPWRPLEAAQ